MSRYDPNKTMVIRTVAPGLTLFSMPFLRFNRIKFGIRTTAIKLTSGNLAIFSPVPWTNEIGRTITTLGGNVNYLIAPDIEHHLSLSAWKKEYPNAMVIGPEGLREKRAKQRKEYVPIDIIYTKQGKRDVKLPEELAQDVEIEYMDGHVNKEICLLHKSTRTLIAADVIFNLPPNVQWSKVEHDQTGWFWNKLANLFTTTQGKGQKLFAWYVLARDKPSVAQSARIISAWDFDRLIPAHGDVIETGGKKVFNRIYGWLMEKM